MNLVERIINNKEEDNSGSKSKIQYRFADKLDDFNFPAIPPYQGIQNDLYLNKIHDQDNSNLMKNQ